MKKAALVVISLLLAVALLLVGTLLPREAEHAELPAGMGQRADEQLPAPSQPSAGGDSQVVVDSHSSADCAAALTTPESSSRLMVAQRRLQIESFLKEQGTPLEQELAADAAGYRRGSELAQEGGLPARLFWAYGPPSPPGDRELTLRERRELTMRLGEEGVEGLIGVGERALLQARWGDTTLAGHLLREHGEALYAALSVADDALPIGLHELAIAIQEDVALADFVTLADSADVDLAETWWNGANLAKVAAIHGRPDILRHLLSNGVEPTAGRRWGRDGSVLDDIASMPEHPRKPRLAEVVEQLIVAGDQPYLPSTLAAFARWLPDVSMPPLHPDAAAALRTRAVQDAARTVAAMDAEWTTKVAGATLLEQRCQDQWAAAEQSAETFRGTGLAIKQRHQQALAMRWERRLKEMVANSDMPAEDDSAAVAALRTQLAEALAQDRWQDAIAIADRQGRNAHLALLHVALRVDAPVDVLVALAGRNGALPEGAIAALAGNRREDLAEVALALEPFGLDVHHVDALGRNAFDILAERDFNEGSWRFAEYLANRYVSVKPSPAGLDPLDRVLMELLDSPRWGSRPRIRFARFLIDHGAPVESSHWQLAQSIARANEDTYWRLVNVVPEIAM